MSDTSLRYRVGEEIYNLLPDTPQYRPFEAGDGFELPYSWRWHFAISNRPSDPRVAAVLAAADRIIAITQQGRHGMTPHDPAALSDATAMDAAQETRMPRYDAEQGAHKESPQPTGMDPAEAILDACHALAKLAQQDYGWSVILETSMAGRAPVYKIEMWSPYPGGDDDA